MPGGSGDCAVWSEYASNVREMRSKEPSRSPACTCGAVVSIAAQAVDVQPEAFDLLGASPPEKECHVAFGIDQPATEIAAKRPGADHHDPIVLSYYRRLGAVSALNFGNRMDRSLISVTALERAGYHVPRACEALIACRSRARLIEVRDAGCRPRAESA